MAEKKQKHKQDFINQHKKESNHHISWYNILWSWQHWPGYRFVIIASFVAGLSVIVLLTSPLLKGETVPGAIKIASPAMVFAADEDENEEPLRYFRYIDGIEVYSDSENNRWPAGVMIENLLSVRPHYGLSDASVVYETLAESGVTRFLVVYDGAGHDVPKIGPVRSARPYYLEWISEYDGLYAHAGGSPEALQAISGLGIKAINGISSGYQYFWRDPTVGAPHNLFTNSDQLGRALGDMGLLEKKPAYRPSLFKDDAPLEDRPVEDRVNPKIDFSSYSYEVRYEYDPDRNTYRRFNGGTEQVDANTKELLRVNNIVIVKVPEEIYLGEKGRINLNLTGEGELLVFRDGVVIKGHWKKQSRDFRTEYFDSNGNEIYLNRGQTWVEVVPGDREVTY
ncbi:DUF3048 domain-containing protein [Patescibacteria group bacterium]